MSEATTTLDEELLAAIETRTEQPADAAPAQPIETSQEAETQTTPEVEYQTADEYIASLESKESKESAPESPKPTGPDPEQVARAVNYFRGKYGERQEAQKALAREERENARALSIGEISEAAYDRRQADIEKKHIDLLNEHHADSLAYAGYDASVQATLREQTSLTEGIQKALGPNFKDFTAAITKIAEEAPQGVVPYATVIEEVTKVARKGWIPREDNTKAVKDAFDAGRRAGEKAIKAGNSGDVRNGTSTGTARVMSDDEYNSLTSTQYADPARQEAIQAKELEMMNRRRS